MILKLLGAGGGCRLLAEHLGLATLMEFAAVTVGRVRRHARLLRASMLLAEHFGLAALGKHLGRTRDFLSHFHSPLADAAGDACSRTHVFSRTWLLSALRQGTRSRHFSGLGLQLFVCRDDLFVIHADGLGD